jgi:ferredoxin--NADP+ reductase
MTEATKTRTTKPALNEPALPDATLHACRPNEPTTGVITKNTICTASRKSAGFVRHIEFDVSGTPLEGVCRSGQSVGVLPEGVDNRGKPHRPRLYSLANPTGGEDGAGKILSTTVKRTIDEDWDNGTLFLGVASNYLCDLQEGDPVQLTGPNGKRFLLPDDTSKHDYIFFATGTGIAPFRGFLKELLDKDEDSRVVLVMGAPYATDLLYHDQLLALSQRHERFTYLTALSRQHNEDGKGRMYVQHRLDSHAELFRPMLASERTLIYVCGIAGMEVGIMQQLARMETGDTLEQYMRAEPEALADIDNWDSKMILRKVKPSKRVLLEVYA